MGELVFLSIIFLIGIVMFVMTSWFPESIIDHSGGPALFPRAVIAVLLCCLAIRIVQVLQTPKEKRKPFAFLEIFKGPSMIFILATILSFVVMHWLGFIISMGLYVPSLMLYYYRLQYGKKPTKKLVAIVIIFSIGGIVLFDYLFCNMLHVLLPKGLIGF
jgi:hypothetical protein